MATLEIDATHVGIGGMAYDKSNVASPMVSTFVEEGASGTSCSNTSTRREALGVNRKLVQKFYGKSYTYWLLVTLSTISTLVGSCAGILILRFYYVHGGTRKWVNTWVQTLGWVITIVMISIPLRLAGRGASIQVTWGLVGAHGGLGILFAIDNFLFSWGLAYLPASTATLLFSSQLVFNSVLAYFMVRQRITAYVTNAVVLVTAATVLLGVYSQSDTPPGVTRAKYVAAFLVTLLASAIYALILVLVELLHTKLMPMANFSTIIESVAYIMAVATFVCLGAMWVNNDFQGMVEEANHSYDLGSLGYILTLVVAAIAFQAFFVGMYGLIFLTSSLLACVFQTAVFPLVPMLSIAVFQEAFSPIKLISLLLSVWGLTSYVYGGYVTTTSALVPQPTPTTESVQLVSHKEGV